MTISPPDRDRIGRDLARFARLAGESLLCHRHPECAHSLKQDGSPVTAADMASQAVIAAALAAEYPQWPAISEESEIQAAPHATPFFLIDPLDGTRAFMAGRDDFCVLIALIENGAPVAGAIHQPVGGGTWWSGSHAFRGLPDGEAEMLVAGPESRPGGMVAMVSAEHASAESRRLCAQFPVAEMRPENSALKFVRLAEGEADIYPRIGRTMQWDVAAGDALLRCLGGGVKSLDGRDLSYGDRGAGWANPDFVAYRRLPA